MEAEGLGAACLEPDAWERGRIATALTASIGAPRPATTHAGEDAAGARGAEIAVRLLDRRPRDGPARDTIIRSIALDKVQEVERLTRWMAAQGEAIAQLERRVHDQTRQRDELVQQLRALQETLGVRMLTRYWSWAKRAVPPGSRRRRLAASLRRVILGSRFLEAPPGTFRAKARGGVAPPMLDDLHAFLERPRVESPPLVALILAPTSLNLDEGQRSTHMAYELARKCVPVMFAYWRWRLDERRSQHALQKGILQIPLDGLLAEPAPVLDAFPASRHLLLIEFPHPRFFGLAAAARGRGWICVYDMVDDWSQFHRVGQAPWYQRDFEVHLLSTADAVVAVSPGLAQRARELAGRAAEIIPNGADRDVSKITQPRPLERGEVTLGYFGHLTRAWFDWELVSAVARARGDWRIHLVGYGDQPPKHLPQNVVLHGKVPRSELASYAANWDVAVIPFKPSPLAASADPVKLYEYLAMGLPVLVTGVTPPPGTEGLVVRVEGADSFIAETIRLARQGEDEARRRMEFAAGCLWEKRLDDLLGLLAGQGQRIALQAALFESEG
jgi:glycosyltransferase involved in cell wall biosynthesis